MPPIIPANSFLLAWGFACAYVFVALAVAVVALAALVYLSLWSACSDSSLRTEGDHGRDEINADVEGFGCRHHDDGAHILRGPASESLQWTKPRWLGVRYGDLRAADDTPARREGDGGYGPTPQRCMREWIWTRCTATTVRELGELRCYRSRTSVKSEQSGGVTWEPWS